MLAAVLLCALAADEPRIEAPGDVEGWHFAAFPIASYGSDIGLLLGGAVFFYRPLAEHPGEQDDFTLSASYATRGPRSLDAVWSKRRLLGSPLHSLLNLHLHDDDRMPYWGEGARLGGVGVAPGYGTPPGPYRYHDERIFAVAMLLGPIAGRLGWHVRARWVDVSADSSALLARSAPPGQRGGRVALGEVGLSYDTRDRPLGPRRGVFVTVAGFAAPHLDGVSDFAFHGGDAAARLYLPLLPGVTLAMRALYDLKRAGLPGQHGPADDVPFFERALYEGEAYGEGMGGAATVRGVARYRFQGDEKALGNVQLRLSLFTTRLAGKTQEWGLTAGVDAAWARQPGYEAVDGSGAALGLRMIWDHAVLARIEVGRTRGGDNGLYIAFGDQF